MSRIANAFAALFGCVTREAHYARVTELLKANSREMERRRDADRLAGELWNRLRWRPGSTLVEEIVAGVETLIAHKVSGPFMDVLTADVERYRALYPTPQFEVEHYSTNNIDHNGDQTDAFDR